MKDPTVMAYVNMFAVLADLEILCTLDDDARKLATTSRPISLGFNVRGGPQATLTFEDGGCRITQGNHGDIKLLLTGCDAFNQMVDGKKNPLPYTGFTRLKFLLENFTGMTDILGSYLRANEKALEDRVFFEKSTTMMFYLVANALSVLGNHDSICRYSAKCIPNGSIALEIADGPCAEIVVKDGAMTTYNRKAESPRAYMVFRDFDTARGLFDGSVEAMSALAAGRIVMKGFIPMIDNLNKILSHVAVYLG